MPSPSETTPVRDKLLKANTRTSLARLNFVFTSSTYNADGTLARSPGARPTLSQNHITLHAKDSINSSSLDYRLPGFIRIPSSRPTINKGRTARVNAIDNEDSISTHFLCKVLYGFESPLTQKTVRLGEYQYRDAGSVIDADEDLSSSRTPTLRSSASSDSLSINTPNEGVEAFLFSLSFGSGSSINHASTLWGPDNSNSIRSSSPTTLTLSEVMEGQASENVREERKSRSFAYPKAAPVVVEEDDPFIYVSVRVLVLDVLLP